MALPIGGPSGVEAALRSALDYKLRVLLVTADLSVMGTPTGVRSPCVMVGAVIVVRVTGAR